MERHTSPSGLVRDGFCLKIVFKTEKTSKQGDIHEQNQQSTTAANHRQWYGDSGMWCAISELVKSGRFTHRR